MQRIPFSVLIIVSLIYPGAIRAQLDDYVVDALVRPKTQQQTITVGDQNSDLQGFSSLAIQIAIDALPVTGGTIQLTEGTFEIIGPVRMRSNVTLQGQGENTILRKCDGFSTHFIIDADYGELKLTVEDASGFVTGMGVQIYDDGLKGGWAVSTAVVTAVVDSTVYVDSYLARDYSADRNGILSNACSIISAVESEKVVIRDLVVDGNKDTNDYINGCRGGAVYIHKSTNTIVENVHVKNFNGDGISWQLTEDVIVRNNEISGCTQSGLHPGTGSPRTIIEGNNSHHNGTDGLFICWRVHHGEVRDNQFHHNDRYGVCTGHKDTDVLFENNHIYENGSDGVHFRGEKATNAPHRNTFARNIVENNGTKSGGYGFSFNSPAEEVILRNNTIRDTGDGSQKAAVYIYKNGLPVVLQENAIIGHPVILFEKED